MRIEVKFQTIFTSIGLQVCGSEIQSLKTNSPLSDVLPPVQCIANFYLLGMILQKWYKTVHQSMVESNNHSHLDLFPKPAHKSYRIGSGIKSHVFTHGLLMASPIHHKWTHMYHIILFKPHSDYRFITLGNGLFCVFCPSVMLEGFSTSQPQCTDLVWYPILQSLKVRIS